jgi:hypothetical protein
LSVSRVVRRTEDICGLRVERFVGPVNGHWEIGRPVDAEAFWRLSLGLKRRHRVTQGRYPRGGSERDIFIVTNITNPDRLRYRNSISDAIADLGPAAQIGQVFSGFQRYLYQQPIAYVPIATTIGIPFASSAPFVVPNASLCVFCAFSRPLPCADRQRSQVTPGSIRTPRRGTASGSSGSRPGPSSRVRRDTRDRASPRCRYSPGNRPSAKSR